uniref:RAP domain-containing protein n=1 Tax=Plectus sambesii TaxID=2011161 RepID=A0A914XBJ0_9BILA
MRPALSCLIRLVVARRLSARRLLLSKCPLAGSATTSKLRAMCSPTDNGSHDFSTSATNVHEMHAEVVRGVAERLRKDKSWVPTEVSERQRLHQSAFAVFAFLPAVRHSSFVDALTVTARWNLNLTNKMKADIAQYIVNNVDSIPTEAFFEIVHCLGHLNLFLGENVLRRIAARGKQLMIFAETQDLVYYVWFWSKQSVSVEAFAPGTMKEWFALSLQEMNFLTIAQASLMLLSLMRCTPCAVPPLPWWEEFVARVLSFKELDFRHAANLLWSAAKLVDNSSQSFRHPALIRHLSTQFVSKIESCNAIELHMGLQALVLLKLNPRYLRYDFWERFAGLFERKKLVETIDVDIMGCILQHCRELHGSFRSLPSVVWDHVIRFDLRQADLRSASYLLFQVAKCRIRLTEEFVDQSEKALTAHLLDSGNDIKWMAYAVLALALLRRPVGPKVWQSLYDVLEASDGSIYEGDFYLLDICILVNDLVLKKPVPPELIKLLLSKWDRVTRLNIPTALLRMRLIYGQRYFPPDVWHLSGTKEFRRSTVEYLTQKHKETETNFDMHHVERAMFDALRRYFPHRPVRAQVLIATIGAVVDFIIDFERHPSLVVQLDGIFHFTLLPNGRSTGQRDVLTDLNTELLKRAGYCVERISASDWASKPDEIMRALRAEYGLVDEKIV